MQPSRMLLEGWHGFVPDYGQEFVVAGLST